MKSWLERMKASRTSSSLLGLVGSPGGAPGGGSPRGVSGGGRDGGVGGWFRGCTVEG